MAIAHTRPSQGTHKAHRLVPSEIAQMWLCDAQMMSMMRKELQLLHFSAPSFAPFLCSIPCLAPVPALLLSDAISPCVAGLIASRPEKSHDDSSAETELDKILVKRIISSSRNSPSSRSRTSSSCRLYKLKK